MSFHVHSTFSDGKDSMEAMVARALELGFSKLGISDHAPFWQESCNMRPQRLGEYFSTISSIKAQYQGRMEVYAGLEIEWHEHGPDAPQGPAMETTGQVPTARTLSSDPRLDYWIGSMHNLVDGGAFYPVDASADMVKETLRTLCGGKGRVMAERYYRAVVHMVESLRPPIVGHMDLIKKHNPTLGFLDPDADWYQALVTRALDAIEAAGSVIEVNTGGMARGYIKEPYPSWDILKEVKTRGIPIQVNSDSHGTATLDFAYQSVYQGLRDLGFSSQRVLGASGWEDLAL